MFVSLKHKRKPKTYIHYLNSTPTSLCVLLAAASFLTVSVLAYRLVATYQTSTAGAGYSSTTAAARRVSVRSTPDMAATAAAPGATAGLRAVLKVRRTSQQCDKL